jgi:cysteine desulfurase
MKVAIGLARQVQLGPDLGKPFLMVKLPIYLDNNSSTRCDPRVLEAMLPFFSEFYGNPASRHHVMGRLAKEAVDTARQQVADLIGAESREIFFTSGATESNNLALKGVAGRYRHQGDHFVTAATEHKAVLDPCRRLQRQGFHLTVLPVDRFGQVTVEQVAEVLTEKTVLVSIMAANNEIGTLQPIRAIGRLCKERGVLFHTDAAQAAGKIPLDVEDMGIDLLSLSAHKIYGPKGTGALFVRSRGPHVRLDPILDGGGHERGLRSGTLAVPGIIGMGRACSLARDGLVAEGQKLSRLRNRLQEGILAELAEVYVNGHPQERLPGTLNLSFARVDGQGLLMSLANVAVSSGSACTSADPEPSYVLRAMGVEDELAQSSIRFSLGRFNTEKEVEQVISEVVRAVKGQRELSPLSRLATFSGKVD